MRLAPVSSAFAAAALVVASTSLAGVQAGPGERLQGARERTLPHLDRVSAQPHAADETRDPKTR